MRSLLNVSHKEADASVDIIVLACLLELSNIAGQLNKVRLIVTYTRVIHVVILYTVIAWTKVLCYSLLSEEADEEHHFFGVSTCTSIPFPSFVCFACGAQMAPGTDG